MCGNENCEKLRCRSKVSPTPNSWEDKEGEEEEEEEEEEES